MRKTFLNQKKSITYFFGWILGESLIISDNYWSRGRTGSDPVVKPLELIFFIQFLPGRAKDVCFIWEIGDIYAIVP